MNVTPIGINTNTVNLKGRSKSISSPNMSNPSNSTDSFQKSETLDKKKEVSFEGFASEAERMRGELSKLRGVLSETKFNEAEAKAEEEILALARKLEDKDSDASEYMCSWYASFPRSSGISEAGIDGLINAYNQPY